MRWRYTSTIFRKAHSSEGRCDMELEEQTCPNCDASTVVAWCKTCGRPFVLSGAHLRGRVRRFGDTPLGKVPGDLGLERCDYCRLKERGQMREAMDAARRQKTCPVCHAVCLSGGKE